MPDDSPTLVIERSLVSVRSIDIFHYFVDPELLVRWWPPVARVEPGVGGGFEFEWPGRWTLYGTYVEFEIGELLSFTWNWVHEPNQCQRVRINFIMEGKDCHIRVQHDQIDSEVNKSDLESGWNHFLDQLKAVIRR